MVALLESAEFWKVATVFLTGIVTLLGYILRDFKNEVKDLKSRVAEMDDRINKVEALVYSIRQGCSDCRADIKEDLLRGEKRFEKIDGNIDKITTSIQSIANDLARLTGNLAGKGIVEK